MPQVKLSNVRLSYNDLFQAKEFKAGDGKPRYSATFLVEPGSEADKAIRAAIRQAAKDTYLDKAEKTLKSFEGNNMRMCYLDGEAKDEIEGYAGNWYLASHASARPTVVDRDRTPLNQADGKPYSGCYVNAIIDIYGQTGDKQGIRAGLKGVQFFKDGAPFGGGAPARVDDFDAFDDLDSEAF